MTRVDFLARYSDILGKRFTVADRTEITREELRLISQDFNALYADALNTSAPCIHNGGGVAKMAKYVELPGYSNPNKAGCLEIISRYGFDQLGGSDGCRCSHFSICGFQIDVSCHKSEHCVRVYSNDLCTHPEDEIEIAALIVKQFADSGEGGYLIRYCDYGHDHKNGHWENKKWIEEYSCCYCGKPRVDKDSYLCSVCLNNKDAVSYYPFGLEPLARKCPECGKTRVEKDLLGLSEMEQKPILVNGTEVGFSMAGAFPKQDGETIFRCLECGHHWREKDATHD
jgi:hypothetical protein